MKGRKNNVILFGELIILYQYFFKDLICVYISNLYLFYIFIRSLQLTRSKSKTYYRHHHRGPFDAHWDKGRFQVFSPSHHATLTSNSNTFNINISSNENRYHNCPRVK